MAKRRRLTPLDLEADRAVDRAGVEPRIAQSEAAGFARTVTRAPIAQIAGDTAERAALANVAQAMTEARIEGRIVERLPLDAIAVDHLVRDRIILGEDDMAALEASLAERGQQTPIEVVEVAEGRYGLVSGWRRVEALRRIGAPTVLALVRRPETVAEAWRAMVEENEIRAPLSFYERARIAAEAADAGLYDSESAAIAGLFASAPSPKRSKIASFVRVHRALGSALHFPVAIPEKLGLALARALASAEFGPRLRDTLRKARPETPEAERKILERALRKAKARPRRRTVKSEVAPGIALEVTRGRLTLEGPGVTSRLIEALSDWLASR